MSPLLWPRLLLLLRPPTKRFCAKFANSRSRSTSLRIAPCSLVLLALLGRGVFRGFLDPLGLKDQLGRQVQLVQRDGMQTLCRSDQRSLC